jgi:hypothetical protein
VECALKACIAKRTKRHDFPEKKTVMDSHTHDPIELLGPAGLKSSNSDVATGFRKELENRDRMESRE